MAGDMISLCASSTTVLPFASKTEIVCALPANMVIAKMVVEGFRVGKGLDAVEPETLMNRGWVSRRR